MWIRKTWLLLAFTTLFVGAQQAAGSIKLFFGDDATARAAWTSHVEGFGTAFTEDFESASKEAGQIVGLLPGLSVQTSGDIVTSGTNKVFSDILNLNDNPLSTTWTFDTPVFGFGQWWNIEKPDILQHLGIVVTTEHGAEITRTIEAGFQGFWGFALEDATDSFKQVVLTTGSAGTQTFQRYTSDNLVFATYSDNGNGDNGNGDNNVIPEPSAMVVWSILAGVVGLTVSWRRRKRA